MYPGRCSLCRNPPSYAGKDDAAQMGMVLFKGNHFVHFILFYARPGALVPKGNRFPYNEENHIQSSAEGRSAVRNPAQNEGFDRKTGKLPLPDILLRSNCSVLKQETAYMPNMGDITLCFIGCIIKYAFPAAVATALLVWGIVSAVSSENIGWLVVFSCVQAAVLASGIPYLYRNIKTRRQMLEEIKNRKL